MNAGVPVSYVGASASTMICSVRTSESSTAAWKGGTAGMLEPSGGGNWRTGGCGGVMA
jgi:hypothetical protein